MRENYIFSIKERNVIRELNNCVQIIQDRKMLTDTESQDNLIQNSSKAHPPPWRPKKGIRLTELVNQ